MKLSIDSQKLRLVLLGLIGVSILAFVVILFTGLSKLEAKSQKLVDLKLQSKTADTQLVSLRQAKKQLSEYGYFKDIAKAVIPADKDQAQALADIFSIANQSGIAIASVTFPASSLGGGASVPAAGATPAPVAGSTQAISQAKPVTGIQGLYSIELTITPQSATAAPADKQVTYPKMLDFLERIERNRRTAQISQVTLQSQAGSLNFSMILNIFIKPEK